jgi:outer membrane protein OmpA-like peptidoglycan-associated protein
MNIRVKLVFATTLIFRIFSHQTVSGQENSAEQIFLFNSAEDFLKLEDYESALSIYTTLDSLHPAHPKYIYGIGLCTFLGFDKPKSLLYFLKAYQFGFKENIINYYLGVSYHFNYDMDNAIYYLEKYLKAFDPCDKNYEKVKTEITHLLQQITESKQMLNRKLSVDIENMGAVVNSGEADYVPIALSNENVLIFTSRREGSTGKKMARDGRHHEDIYVTKKDSLGYWSAPSHLAGLNSKYHDANVALNKDESELYVYTVKHKGDIYKSKKNKDDIWSNPRPVKGINSRHWEGSICFSPSEDTIYFSSDRPEGFGGSDLYYAVKDINGKWTAIKNLGPEINTSLDEDAPYMYKDGKTFFFSSKGHNSVGGYDIFSAKKNQEGKWENLKNAGFPINTIDDDIYFHLNSESSLGYFTSFRHSNFKEKSVGEKDLFQIKRPNSSPVYFVFKGRVFSEESKEPIAAIVTLKNLEDSTSVDQRVVVDINSGKFKCDLKFRNKYKLTVEVGDKVYYSKELFFPFQADLFETFLDIPLKDIPIFKMKLNDVLANQPDSSRNTTLNDPKSVIVLVRKVHYNDPELKELLLSNKIPVTFRKRLLDQLEDTQYLDTKEEGNIKEDLFEELKEIESMELPEIYSKLESGEKNDIKRLDIKNNLNTKNTSELSKPDSTTWNNLSDIEKRIIERLSDFALETDSAKSLKVIDELYYKNLKPDEILKVNHLLADKILKNNNKGESPSEDTYEKLYALIDQARKEILSRKINLQGYSKEAWGILYTAETSGFRCNRNERLTLKGKVVHRNSGKACNEIKLVLTDDQGLIYSQQTTSDLGHVEFKNLMPSKRYHVLVDDYSIQIIGQSRYEFSEIFITSNSEEYLRFYNNLTPEQKKSVDRIVAHKSLEDDYKKTPTHEWEDDLEFSKLQQTEKAFVEKLRKYLSARRSNDSVFFMHKNDAYKYEQLNGEVREKYNRYITRGTAVTTEDSLFFEKLTKTEKDHINYLTDTRKAKKIIFDDILISKADADYWYVVGEIQTLSKKVKITGSIIDEKKKEKGILQVGLVDEFNQVAFTAETDSAGYFIFPSVDSNKKFKVLISQGSNISNISDYKLKNVEMQDSNDDFYVGLTENEKRIVDRIVATNMANESYKNDPNLLLNDDNQFELLSGEEKAFIDRLSLHLLADSVSSENARLHRVDNNYYYSILSGTERSFINRYLIKSNADRQFNKNFALKANDKLFYDRLSENQKIVIAQLQNQRKAKADIFAENPILMIDKVWLILDTLNLHHGTNAKFSLDGKLVSKKTKQPLSGIPVMVSDNRNNVIGILSTDSTGHFALGNLSSDEGYYVLAESKRTLFSKTSEYELTDLQIAFSAQDNINFKKDQPVKLVANDTTSVVVYFEYNAFKLLRKEEEILNQWIIKNKMSLMHAEISIDGHTDSSGSDSYNQTLSEKRAGNIKLILTHYVSGDHVEVAGYGESKLKYFGKHFQRNRRVEIKVLN